MIIVSNTAIIIENSFATFVIESVNFIENSVDVKNDISNDIEGRSVHFQDDVFNTIKSVSGKTVIFKYPISHYVIPDAECYVSFMLDDILALENIEKCSVLYQLRKTLFINGFLYIHGVSLLFINCNFYVGKDGLFQSGDILFDYTGEASKLAHTTITMVGKDAIYYGDNYKNKKHLSPVIENGKICFTNTDIISDISSSLRSDFDFRENTTISLYNSTLSGTGSSYHHLNSNKMIICNFTVLNSTSVELLKKPISMKNFTTISCINGLSFLPVSQTLETPVYIYELNIIDYKKYTIKRNGYSGLIMVNPLFDGFDKMEMLGVAPIKVVYTSTDNLKDDKGVPITDHQIDYYHSKKDITINASNNRLIANENFLFNYVLPEDTLYVTDDEKGLSDGETFTIKSLNNTICTVNETITKTYTNPYFYVKISTVSDEYGNVGEVIIPAGYIKRSKNTYNKYEKAILQTTYKGTIFRNEFTPVKRNGTIVLYEDILTDEPGTGSVIDNDILTQINIKLATVQQTLDDQVFPVVDLSPIIVKVDTVQQTLDDQVFPVVDLSPIIVKVDTVQQTLDDQVFPVVDLSPIIVKVDTVQQTLDDQVFPVVDLSHILTGISDLKISFDSLNSSSNDYSDIISKIDEINVTADVGGIMTTLSELTNSIGSGTVDLSSVSNSIEDLKTSLNYQLSSIDLSTLSSKMDEVKMSVDSHSDHVDITSITSSIGELKAYIMDFYANQVDPTDPTDDVDLAFITVLLESIRTSVESNGQFIDISEIIKKMDELKTSVDSFNFKRVLRRITNLKNTVIKKVTVTDLTPVLDKIEAFEIKANITDLTPVLTKIDSLDMSVDLTPVLTKIDSLDMSVDLTPVLTKIDSLDMSVDLTPVLTKIDSLDMSVDLTPVLTKIDELPITDLTPVLTKIDELPITDLTPVLTKIDGLETVVKNEVGITDLTSVITKITELKTIVINKVSVTDLTSVLDKIETIVVSQPTDLTHVLVMIEDLKSTVTTLDVTTDLKPVLDRLDDLSNLSGNIFSIKSGKLFVNDKKTFPVIRII